DGAERPRRAPRTETRRRAPHRLRAHFGPAAGHRHTERRHRPRAGRCSCRPANRHRAPTAKNFTGKEPMSGNSFSFRFQRDLRMSRFKTRPFCPTLLPRRAKLSTGPSHEPQLTELTPIGWTVFGLSWANESTSRRSV